MDGSTGAWMYGCMGGLIHEYMAGCMYGRVGRTMGVRMCKWVHGWMDGGMHI